ncbi:MAG: queuosine precursor transporter [Planctomycetota bacterium]|nr:queuosine precursor transporter [Planctomycetota bacterium]
MSVMTSTSTSSNASDAARASSPLPAAQGQGALPTPQLVYLALAGVFITCLLMSNVLGVKLFKIETSFLGITKLFGSESITIVHTVGMICFPITFVLTDLLNEYFGKRGARRVIYIAFAMGMLAFGLISFGRALPTLEGIPNTADSASFEVVFGSATLMYLSSMLAFLLGSLLDIVLFQFFFMLTGGRYVWMRTTGSTIVSQLFDSFLVTFAYFYAFPKLMGHDPAELGFVASTALTGYVLKFAFAVLLTPVIYAGRAILRDWFGLKAMTKEQRAAGG